MLLWLKIVFVLVLAVGICASDWVQRNKVTVKSSSLVTRVCQKVISLTMKLVCYSTYSTQRSAHSAHHFSNFFCPSVRKIRYIVTESPLNHWKFPPFQTLLKVRKQETDRESKIWWVGWIIYALKLQIFQNIWYLVSEHIVTSSFTICLSSHPLIDTTS